MQWSVKRRQDNLLILLLLFLFFLIILAAILMNAHPAAASLMRGHPRFHTEATSANYPKNSAHNSQHAIPTTHRL